MSDYSALNFWVKKSSVLIIVLMFCGYYFFMSALCFLIVSSDEALALQAFMDSGLMKVGVSWGFFSASFLCLGLIFRAFGLDAFSNKRDGVNVVNRMFYLLLAMSVLLVPALVLGNSPSIRQAFSPIELGTLTVSFLIALTAAFYRRGKVSSEIQHAK